MSGPLSCATVLSGGDKSGFRKAVRLPPRQAVAPDLLALLEPPAPRFSVSSPLEWTIPSNSQNVPRGFQAGRTRSLIDPTSMFIALGRSAMWPTKNTRVATQTKASRMPTLSETCAKDRLFRRVAALAGANLLGAGLLRFPRVTSGEAKATIKRRRRIQPGTLGLASVQDRNGEGGVERKEQAARPSTKAATSDPDEQRQDRDGSQPEHETNPSCGSGDTATKKVGKMPQREG